MFGTRSRKCMQGCLLVVIACTFVYCYSIGLHKWIPQMEGHILQEHCTMDKCFQKNKCSLASNFKAFVYPDKYGRTPLNNLIFGKKYFTNDINQACIFVYLYDENATELSELKYLGQQDNNHLIINLNSYDVRSFNISSALIAQPVYSSKNLRPGYDFLSPLYNEALSHNRDSFAPVFPLKRKWLLSYTENRDSPHVKKEELCKYMKKLHEESSESRGTVFFQCSTGITMLEASPNQIFAESTFTIILIHPNAQATPAFQKLLLTALFKGSIPVLVGAENKKLILPLAEYVSWDKIVVSVPTSNIKDIGSIVSKFTEADVDQMKRDGRYAMEFLLIRKEAIIACILETIMKRLDFPAIGFQPTLAQRLFIRYPINTTKDTDYRQPNAYNYGEHFLSEMTIPPKALSFIQPNLGIGRSWPAEKFTLVIVTYHREKVLKQIVRQYKSLAHLDRIVLIWNAFNEKVKPELIPDMPVPVYVITNGKNSLNNRFVPFDVIRTQAVFTTDDDISLENGNIVFAFRVWRENRDRIVGFPGRYHEWSSRRKVWFYSAGDKIGQSLVLTGAAFLHKHYFYLFSYVMNPAIREAIDTKFNCEDIAMNMLVAYVTKKPPLKVFRVKYFPNKFHLKDGISYRKGHKDKRDWCVNEFTKYYGYQPLINTQFVVDYPLTKSTYNGRFYKVL